MKRSTVPVVVFVVPGGSLLPSGARVKTLEPPFLKNARPVMQRTMAA